MSDYSEYESIKQILRLPNDSIKDELMLYMQEVDILINNRLREKLGYVDGNGDDVTLPLTASTRPAIDIELKTIASDLVVGKFRLKNSEKPLLWDTAVKALENYMERRFGWTSSTKYPVRQTLTYSPTSGTSGTTVTLSGTGWLSNAVIYVYFGGAIMTTSPTTVTTDSTGSFSSATFSVPTWVTTGSYEINIRDTQNGIVKRFRVT